MGNCSLEKDDEGKSKATKAQQNEVPRQLDTRRMFFNLTAKDTKKRHILSIVWRF